jgi:serine/threonine protein kinase
MQSEFSTLGSFVGDEVIGTGSFASVWAAHHLVADARVAIKVIPKSNLTSEDNHTRFIREISLMKQLTHPFITPMFAVIENPDCYCMLLELAGRGNLRDRINSHGFLNEDDARHYFCQIVCVLDYMHNEKHIAHRDLKCENILFDCHNNIRVIDFGLSRSCAGEAMRTACGSPAYAAPEVITQQPYTVTADIWSLGVVLYAMTVGVLPFNHDEVGQLLRLIVEKPVEIPAFLSASLTDLLRRRLCKQADRRITLDKIKQHPWFPLTEYNETIEICGCEIANLSVPKPIPDPAILISMRNFGFDPGLLVRELYQGVESDGTIVYSILNRVALTERMDGVGTGRVKLRLDRAPVMVKVTRGQTTKPIEVIPAGLARKMGIRRNPRPFRASFALSTVQRTSS